MVSLESCFETKAGDFTERGCSLLGCRVVVCGQVKNVVHLVHSPIGCAYYSWDYRMDTKGYCFTTDMNEIDIVFGGENKLLKAVLLAIEEFSPDAVFIYETCSTSIIGDDIQAVAKKASDLTGIPVIAFNCAGFRGKSQNFGHRIANLGLFNIILDGERKEMVNTVNLIGDFNKKDSEILERLFGEIGIKVICTFTANATIDKIRDMKNAELNIVMCSKSSIFLAELMEEKYGIPYVELNFFGLDNCCKSLYKISEYFNNLNVEEVIHENMSWIKMKIDKYKNILEDKRVFICHGAQRAIYWIKPFEELGMKVVGIATHFGGEIPNFDGLVVDNLSSDELEKILEKVRPDIVVSDDKIRHLVHKMSIPFFNGRGQNRGYSGFEGFLNFAKDVGETLNAKLWYLARDFGGFNV